jgi:CIC family chloride channel protein
MIKQLQYQWRWGSFFSKRFFRRLAQRVQISENTILLGLAILVGLGSGAGIWVFREGIHYSELFFQGYLADEQLHPWLGDFGRIIALGLLGLIVGTIVQVFVGEEKHHGVAGIIESVALVGGRLPYKKIPFKAGAAALSIGGGASVGPEDPSVQIGANLGSFLGQQLGLSEERVKLLVAAGAASAVAAAFKAPIAGVFFALEVILGNFGTGSVGVVVLAAVMSSVFTQSVESGDPELGIRTFQLGGPEQIPFYILLGLLSAPVAAGFIQMVYWQRGVWHEWKAPRPLKTATAGLIVGLVATGFPEIMGAGRETMNEVLNTGGGVFSIEFLAFLVAAKIAMTSLSMGGGFVGGIFAPSLFTGAMLGGAYGRLISQAFPNQNIGDPAAYAIAGMAAMMAGVVRAPITAILLIFELTNNYQLILPIMLATVVTVYLTERMETEGGIYTKALKRAGVHIQEGRDVDVMQSIEVREVMRTPPPVISPQANLAELRDAMRRFQTKALCVIEDRHDKQLLRGIVAMSDLQTAYETATEAKVNVELLADDICVREVVTVNPHDPLFVAIRRLSRHDIGHLPVVAAENDRALLGFLTRTDVMRGYEIALTRKWESQHAQNEIRLKNLVNEQVLALKIPANAQIVGKFLQKLNWPAESVVVSVRRGNHTLIPSADLILEAGDELTIVARPEAVAKIEGIINAPSLKFLGLED